MSTKLGQKKKLEKYLHLKNLKKRNPWITFKKIFLKDIYFCSFCEIKNPLKTRLHSDKFNMARKR